MLVGLAFHCIKTTKQKQKKTKKQKRKTKHESGDLVHTFHIKRTGGCKNALFQSVNVKMAWDELPK